MHSHTPPQKCPCLGTPLTEKDVTHPALREGCHASRSPRRMSRSPMCACAEDGVKPNAHVRDRAATSRPRKCASSPRSRGQSRYCNKDNPTQIQQCECAIMSKHHHGSDKMHNKQCSSNGEMPRKKDDEVPRKRRRRKRQQQKSTSVGARQNQYALTQMPTIGRRAIIRRKGNK